MAASESTLQSFELDPSIGTNLNLSYTNRKYQTSNVIIQDQRKEGILYFFQNINYNEREDLSQTKEETPDNQASAMGPSSGTSGTYQ